MKETDLVVRKIMMCLRNAEKSIWPPTKSGRQKIETGAWRDTGERALPGHCGAPEAGGHEGKGLGRGDMRQGRQEGAPRQSLASTEGV